MRALVRAQGTAVRIVDGIDVLAGDKDIKDRFGGGLEAGGFAFTSLLTIGIFTLNQETALQEYCAPQSYR